MYLGSAGETTGTGQRYNLVVAGAFLIRVICPTDGVSAKELLGAGGGGYLYMVAKDRVSGVQVVKKLSAVSYQHSVFCWIFVRMNCQL
ncbi:MAG TPA: hypothetical protein DEQ06_00445 [Porphyromonadaceae bacterium]|jgi:hypothetical protein|nr:hypothetical protein [Porphyromonadaceae bacterium]